MTQYTSKPTNFEFYVEDIKCEYCLYFKGNNKHYKNGCWEETCHYENQRREAEENGRIERKKGEPHYAPHAK